ncbi:hypothetical protein FHS18_001075 [Paenibacillus phyllosphaerae]|uniref:DUF4190 domain-containing protein n=1 Tax=Paenibacillus phyllosphaerae TaxID=274593 RepID=A0A7W5AUJ3_9BACL|nr:hypothetical protein [Paenibacillus phyllosphaerae]MBB3109023.1 hypothetical protein [Paenibacillus phyllosphaerae]
MERDRDYSPYDDSETCPHMNSRDCQEFKEEMAAEIAIPATYSGLSRTRSREDESKKAMRSAGRAAGWAGLVIAIMSWFVWPVLLGLSAAFIGYVAFRQGSRGLGIWSMTLGLIAAVTYLVLIPLYYAYAVT